MEALIGIFSSSGEYAARLAAYINSRRDVGCGGVSFKNNSELVEFFESRDLSILLTDDPTHLKLYEDRARVCLLCDDREKTENAYRSDCIFKFQRAPVLLQELLPGLEKDFVRNNIYTVFSPTSNQRAREFAREKARELAAGGRTLIIFWDPFGAFGRNAEEGVSVSELLFTVRKNRSGFKGLLLRLSHEDGVFSLKGTDFYSDLWRFSPAEMEELADLCRTEGDFDHVIFECSFMSEAVEKLMEISDEVFIVPDGESDPGPEEFLRQMKYAGKQEILLRVGGEAGHG
ncbi:MAG: hypothetical protein K6F63_02385 [Lachnospiraceae bacterium]|nr:hypothetical protein [Lachnospiraceae bacterium]